MIPGGETITEFMGVGVAAIARGASLTAGLVLTSVNDSDSPNYDSEKHFMRDHFHMVPATPDQLRLANLEHLYEQGTLTPEQEAELIVLLAKVKGIHVQRLVDLPGPKSNGRVTILIFTPLLPNEGEVGTYRELGRTGPIGDCMPPHHVPSDAYIKQHGIARNDGVCINME